MLLQEEYANIKDLQQFYAEQKPEAYGTTFEFQSVSGVCNIYFTPFYRLETYDLPFSGGINDQHLEKAGIQANLDTQFAFGLTYPARVSLWLRTLSNTLKFVIALGSLLVHRWTPALQA